MQNLKNDVFLRALRREPVPYTPVWMMRQAGRYLEEYKATRAQAGDFMSLCKSTDLATEVTLQPLDRFDLDAAILFSDILTIPDAMGLGLSFVAGEGPRFAHPLRHERDILKLHAPDVGTTLSYVTDAVSSIRHALDGRVPLIGFSGSPFTLACYMIEGGPGGNEYAQVKQMLYSRPDLLHHILAVNAQAVTEYLNAQITAGAQAVMIFDTWGGLLAHHHYPLFSLQYMAQILEGLRPGEDGRPVPTILYTKGGGLWLEAMATTGASALGLDWSISLADARRRVGHQVALQGNLDPFALFARPETIEAEVARILAEYGNGSGHVFNLGHGINQHTPPEHAKVLVDAVHRLSKEYHQKT